MSPKLQSKLWHVVEQQRPGVPKYKYYSEVLGKSHGHSTAQFSHVWWFWRWTWSRSEDHRAAGLCSVTPSALAAASQPSLRVSSAPGYQLLLFWSEPLRITDPDQARVRVQEKERSKQVRGCFQWVAELNPTRLTIYWVGFWNVTRETNNWFCFEGESFDNCVHSCCQFIRNTYCS